MSRRGLGNDPFKRGAAVRKDAGALAKPKKPRAAKAAVKAMLANAPAAEAPAAAPKVEKAAKANTPVAEAPKVEKAAVKAMSANAPVAEAPEVEKAPVKAMLWNAPVAEAPEVKTAREPRALPVTPELQRPTHGARAPAGQPADRATKAPESAASAAVERPRVPAPAEARLFAGGPRGSAPRAHPEVPTVHEFTAHAEVPVAQELVPHEPVPHPGAPQASELRDTEPVAHPGAPTVAEVLSPAEEPPPAVPPEEHAKPPEPRRDAAPLSTALRGLYRAAKMAASMASTALRLDSWGQDLDLVRSLRPVADLLYDKYWRVRVEGAAGVPAGACMLVANHAGALPLDGPVLHLALKRERPELADSRWLLEDQVFYTPFLGGLANRLGAVRATPENALELLDEGRPLIVFPEGVHGMSKPFAERYQLRRFGRGGYVKIALRAKVPIVPVALVGGEESLPLLAKIPAGPLGVPYVPLTLPPLPARWHLRFGAPIHLERGEEDEASFVQTTNDRVRDEIQTMLSAMLSERTSVF